MAREARQLHSFLSAVGGCLLVQGVYYLVAPHPVRHHPAIAVVMLTIGAVCAAAGLSLYYSARR